MTTTSLATAWTEQAPHQTALMALQRFHWSVLPLDEEKKPPQTGATHPDGTPKRLAWKHLQTRRASTHDIQHWQNTYAPSAWAVITGTISGLIILDFDGTEGQETRVRLGLKEPHIQTGSGGHHVYFRHPGWPVPTLNSKSKQALGRRWPGLDIRADGGYAAFCGKSRSGSYLVLREPIPEELSLLPADLRAMLGLLSAPAATTEVDSDNDQRDAKADSLNPVMLRIAASTLIQRALGMIKHKQMGRNDAGFWLACQLRDNGYAEEEAKQALQDYVAQVPGTNSKGQAEPYTLEEAFASVSSAFRQGPRAAWDVAPVPQPAPAGSGGGRAGTRTAMGTAEEPEGLPEIIVGGDQLRDFVDQAIEAIMRREGMTPTLFLQAARLVSVGRDEERRPIITQVGVPEIKEVLTHSANFYRIKKVPGDDGACAKLPCSPPKELAEQILARQTQKPYLPFPPLMAIVEVPVIRPDGSLLDQPGYDRKTRLYYAPHTDLGPISVPLNPTPEEREAALACVWDAIGEFPYASRADKANALGLLLTPILRPAIKRHVPLALIDAPKQGTGKGLLSDVVSLIATGTSASILTLSDNPDEVQKAITSLLIEGATIITIDNVVERLKSKHLDGVLTSDWWQGRILGASKMARVPQRATWIATGNNIRLGGDIARRCYRIRLDAKVSKPFKRKGFKHSDLASWVKDHRGELVSALLTLARAWFAAGCPRYNHLPAMATLTGWVETIGGILEYAGVGGFLANLDELHDQADEDGPQWEAFLHAWRLRWGEAWISTEELCQVVTVAGGVNENGQNSLVDALPEALQLALKARPNTFNVIIGKALDRRVETCFGEENLHLERIKDKHSKKNLWRVFAGGVSLATRSEHCDLSLQKIGNRKSDRKYPPHPPHPSDQTQVPHGSTSGLEADSPWNTEEEHQSAENTPQSVSTGGMETILLVDDPVKSADSLPAHETQPSAHDEEEREEFEL